MVLLSSVLFRSSKVSDLKHHFQTLQTLYYKEYLFYRKQRSIQTAISQRVFCDLGEMPTLCFMRAIYPHAPLLLVKKGLTEISEVDHLEGPKTMALGRECF